MNVKARINKYYNYTNACNQCAKTFVIHCHVPIPFKEAVS